MIVTLSRQITHALAGRRGLALVAVLWGMTLLALMTASFSTSSRTDVTLTYNALESAKAELLAEAGLHRTILGLLATDEEGKQWRVDGSIYGWRFDGGDIRVSVQDEGGKIDLNAAQNDLLRALFLSAEVDPDLADTLVDSILDFRDPDDLRHHSGAEDDDYAAAGLKHDAKDGPFDSIEELNQVYGMTAALYEQVAPALTIHSGRAEPVAQVAPPEVEAALGDAAYARDTERGAGEEVEDAADTGGTAGARALDEDAEEEPLLETESPVPVLLREGKTELRSGVPAFLIHAEGRAPSGAVFALETVVQVPAQDGAPYAFMTWRRGERKHFIDIEETAAIE